MPIKVIITKSPEFVNIFESSKVFNEQGGSLGRGKNNDWVLDDPDRYLSSYHCQISCENGQFYIIDLSINGTFFNGSTKPMGKGSKLPLNHGDTFILGEYAFSVSLDSTSLNARSVPFNIPSQLDQIDPMNQQVNGADSAVEQGDGAIPDDWGEDLSCKLVVNPRATKLPSRLDVRVLSNYTIPTEQVEFGVFFPKCIVSNSLFCLDVWAYLSSEYSDVLRFLRRLKLGAILEKLLLHVKEF